MSIASSAGAIDAATVDGTRDQDRYVDLAVLCRHRQTAGSWLWRPETDGSTGSRCPIWTRCPAFAAILDAEENNSSLEQAIEGFLDEERPGMALKRRAGRRK